MDDSPQARNAGAPTIRPCSREPSTGLSGGNRHLGTRNKRHWRNSDQGSLDPWQEPFQRNHDEFGEGAASVLILDRVRREDRETLRELVSADHSSPDTLSVRHISASDFSIKLILLY